MAIEEQGSHPIGFGPNEFTEVCLTNKGGHDYASVGGFEAYETQWNKPSWMTHNPWQSCSSLRSGDYRMTATCIGPPSSSEIRIVGGLDSSGRLGKYKPEEGVSKKNDEKILIWEKNDMTSENKDLILRYQEKERGESRNDIQSKTTGRNIMILIAVICILVIVGLCLCG